MVLEVISALLAAYGIFEEEIEKIKADKVNITGSFDPNNYVHYIEGSKNNIEAINYLENKTRDYKLLINL